MVFIRLPYSGLVLVAERVKNGFQALERDGFYATDEVEVLGKV